MEWLLHGIFEHTAIRSFQNYLARVCVYTGTIEQERQWHASPFRRADCAKVPLHPFDFWLEKIAIVPRAFQRYRDGHRFQLEKLFVIDCEWTVNFTFDMQPPRISIDRGNRKMRANVK